MKTRVLNLGLSLVLSLAVSACNKEEFYEKEFLDTPTDVVPTDGSANGGTQGSVDGGAGSTQGGVDSGAVDGGSTGGSTTGSTTGGVDGTTTGGSTTGGTTGGVDGTTTGGSTTGGTTGGVDGSTTTGGSTGGSATTGGSTGGTTTGGSTTGGSTTGGTTGGVSMTEVFLQTSSQSKKLDIVWIIDNSGSMQDEQDALGANFSAFIDDFIHKDVDFKMAITTTDASTADKKGRMVTGSNTKLTSAKAKENEAQFKADFSSLINVGTRGSGNEKGLAASEGFMEKYATTFVRPEAYLAVVVVSDEEDQSSKTVNEYTNYLKSFKSNEGLVKVYSVVDVNNTNVGGNGITTGSERYKQASNNTAGLIADIRENFYGVLTQMGDSIINLLDSFALANEPLPGTLRVYVNNVESFDYTYDSASRSIKFNQNAIPVVGAEIKVYYVK